MLDRFYRMFLAILLLGMAVSIIFGIHAWALILWDKLNEIRGRDTWSSFTVTRETIHSVYRDSPFLERFPVWARNIAALLYVIGLMVVPLIAIWLVWEIMSRGVAGLWSDFKRTSLP